jgi:hypothetical protein
LERAIILVANLNKTLVIHDVQVDKKRLKKTNKQTNKDSRKPCGSEAVNSPFLIGN